MTITRYLTKAVLWLMLAAVCILLSGCQWYNVHTHGTDPSVCITEVGPTGWCIVPDAAYPTVDPNPVTYPTATP
jgi:hypothetical protein